MTSWNNCGAKGQQEQLNMHRIAKKKGMVPFISQAPAARKYPNFLGISIFWASSLSHVLQLTDWTELLCFGGNYVGFLGGAEGCEICPPGCAINLFAINLRPAAMQAIATTEAENRNRIRNSNKWQLKHFIPIWHGLTEIQQLLTTVC